MLKNPTCFIKLQKKKTLSYSVVRGNQTGLGPAYFFILKMFFFLKLKYFYFFLYFKLIVFYCFQIILMR